MQPSATLYEKIWNAHVVDRLPDGTCLVAVDRELIYEGASVALAGLARTSRKVRRPRSVLAMADHMVPTRNRAAFTGAARQFIDALRADCEAAGIRYFDLDDPRHGIVHVVGPEQGFTQPGLLMACADSHTSSHGAVGALAFGIGTSELEHVLATQTLMQRPSKTMRVTLDGQVHPAIAGKDLILAVLREIGVGGGIGHAIEFAGSAVAALSMTGRFTLCNMAVEAGARVGIVAPDETTFAWLEGRPMSPPPQYWNAAVDYWRTLRSDDGAQFNREVRLDVSTVVPLVTWGTSPDESVPVDGAVPDPAHASSPQQADAWRRALQYMGLQPGTRIKDIPIDRVFIGSCTNSRLDDLRAAALVLRGHKLARGVHGMVAPGSSVVKQAAEREGLHQVFLDAGFEWRDAGCSMCYGSANDSVAAGERCASTSNRNYENRQGAGARTHLVSPAMAAAAGVAGRFADVREFT